MASKVGYLGNPRYWIEKVTAASSVVFIPHALRRTFITITENLDILTARRQAYEQVAS